MNAEQRAARDAFATLLRNAEQADAIYNALPEARGGKIVSTDLARFLDTRYRDSPKGQARDLVPGWDLAWRYAQGRLRREIENRNGRTVLRFMAGGWGAGKTHALQGAELADIAWDGTEGVLVVAENDRPRARPRVAGGDRVRFSRYRACPLWRCRTRQERRPGCSAKGPAGESSRCADIHPATAPVLRRPSTDCLPALA